MIEPPCLIWRVASFISPSCSIGRPAGSVVAVVDHDGSGLCVETLEDALARHGAFAARALNLRTKDIRTALEAALLTEQLAGRSVIISALFLSSAVSSRK
jgi:hypothetical protein